MKQFYLLLLCFSFSFSFSQQIEIELFANGLSSPVGIENAGDDRLFVVEQFGTISIIDVNGIVNGTPFLNIDDRVTNNGGEQGLLGLAFHPDYITNGFFFVNYINNNGDTVVSRFSRSTTNTANPNSELIILTIAQPFANHNGGDLAFGSDGYLYIGTGDGGNGGDPGNRAQNLMELLGKMLRIDVDNTSNGNNYAIPSDNPFVGNPNALDEIWAYGLRNPWRFSFDTVTNELWIGDVGQDATEEINRVSVATIGYNFGWRCYEGSGAFNTSGCPPIEELTFPVAEYPIPPCFCSVAGGQVYRGSVYSDILGVYIFATTGDGTISTVDASNNLINHGNYNNGFWVAFGEDINKEMYVVDITGSIYRVKGGVLSVTEFEEQSISITPNPASENLNISIINKTITTVTIIDVKGSVFFSEKNIFLSEKNIDVSFLSKGIYFVKIEIENESAIVKKLIVK